MKRLNNKVAIITGGASNPGLGHSTIHKFAEEGAKIVVHKKSLIGSYNKPSGWEAFGIISSQLGDLATALLTLMLLSNQANSSNGG